ETTSIYECFQAYKRMLVAHSHAAFATASSSSQDGDPSMATLGVFRSADVRLLTDFVTGALFQQFLLYQCVLICPQDSVTSYTEVELLQPLPPPDLKKAVSKKKAAQAKAGHAKKAYAARSKGTTYTEVSPEDAEAETEGVSLDQTFSQFPKDLTIDEHHEESTKAAEVKSQFQWSILSIERTCHSSLSSLPRNAGLSPAVLKLDWRARHAPKLEYTCAAAPIKACCTALCKEKTARHPLDSGPFNLDRGWSAFASCGSEPETEKPEVLLWENHLTEDASLLKVLMISTLFDSDKEHYGQSRNYFEALIQQGAVRVNGQQRKKSFKKFRSGDVIDVRFLVDIRTLPLEPDILYEDDELLVINKAAGLVVHPAPGNWNGTLVNGVLHHLGFASSELSTLPNAAELRPGIVHRLDVGTTGVIAVAKTVSSYSVLSQAFAQREVQKTYLAVVLGGRKSFFGHPKGSGHRVEKAIGRSTTDRRLMTTLDGGRPALSFVRGIAREKELLLVEVKPRTGRTHQIRVHLADEHSPILGDTAYGWHHMNRRYAQLAQRPM
ncbi:unnamed protein product, partial [Cladocopium goreaui]